MKLSTLLIVVTLALLVMPASVHAQNYQGSTNINGPTVSPYLNLINNNNLLNGGAGTYQSLVRPLIDSNSAIKRQGGAIQQLQQQAYSGGGGGGGLGTGHGSYFMNYSHYFPMAGGRRR